MFSFDPSRNVVVVGALVGVLVAALVATLLGISASAISASAVRLQRLLRS